MNRKQAEEAATVAMERYFGAPRDTWGGARRTHEELTRLYMNQVNFLDRLVSRALGLFIIVMLGVSACGIAVFGAGPPPIKCVEVEPN